MVFQCGHVGQGPPVQIAPVTYIAVTPVPPTPRVDRRDPPPEAPRPKAALPPGVGVRLDRSA
jgi:hypothetical protein